ncbi:MAG: NAD(+) synthase [Candidatus Syntrophopropionicum ammoniitolerans]
MSAVGIERVVIGLSGGIDSAISACLYNQVLDPRQLLLVNMPSVYSSQTTRDLSARLAKNLGCLYTIMPIQKIFTDTVRQIGETPVRNPQDGSRFHLTVSSFVQESIQARDRSARILAGVAAAFGGGFTCNTNKSELTVGYGTLYGDLAGFLAALADLWKYQIYELALYLNENIYCREVIPQEIITLVASAELSASQDVDQGKGDPLVYPYHDYLFRAFVEREGRTTPEEILTWYCTGCLEDKIGCRAGLVKELFSGAREFIADLERWWGLYRGMGVAKRIQAPPVLAVSKRAYGFEPGEVQNPVHFTAGYHRLKEKTIRHAE